MVAHTAASMIAFFASTRPDGQPVAKRHAVTRVRDESANAPLLDRLSKTLRRRFDLGLAAQHVEERLDIGSAVGARHLLAQEALRFRRHLG